MLGEVGDVGRLADGVDIGFACGRGAGWEAEL